MLKRLQKLLRHYLSNVYCRGVAVLLGAFVSDFVWARYIAHIADANKLAAANWGVVVIVLGAFLVLSYVEDRRLILPAAIGAWLGTYFAV